MKPNNNRILAIDLGRGMSVIMMMCVHTLWIYADKETQMDSWLGHLVHFIGKGTPMFLITMGISFTLSRSQSATASFKRGLWILAAAYLMNLLKFIVPIVVFDAMPESFIQAYGWTPPLQLQNYMFLLLTGDILQMAGVSLLFLGFIYAYSPNKYWILALAFAIAFASPYVRGLQLGVPGLDYICDLLWGKDYNVYFPVFPWMSFILLGMFLGQCYKEKGHDEAFLFRMFLPLGIGLTLVGGLLCYLDFAWHFADFFHLGFGGTLYLMGINLLLFWVINLLVVSVKPNIIFDFLYYCSKHVTSLYVIQWVLVCWGMMAIGFMEQGVGMVLLLMPIVIVLSLAIQYMWSILTRHKNQNTRVKTQEKETLQIVV